MSEISTATAKAYSNIAFIKYWGNRDNDLRLPSNGSISMNLKGVETVTTVAFDPTMGKDRLTLNGKMPAETVLQRVSKHLDRIREMAGIEYPAVVLSENNFPMGSGIASSASAFAALTLAGCAAAGLALNEKELSITARLGSGSASRSVPGGYVEWYAGDSHQGSYAETITPADHWRLVDLVAVISAEHKSVGSTGGHTLAPTSPLQAARVADTPRRLGLCREAIVARDFEKLADVVELDTLIMHSVMMTSTPSLMYWLPPTLRIMQAVRKWRQAGIAVCFTIDAGANVHVITTEADAPAVRRRLETFEEIQDVLEANPGGSAHLLDQHLSG